MNEFIEQFLVESRELVAQGTDDLLALEEQPSDRERLDSAFRAFHTLKGAAGIIEFDAMGVALHGAEDVLGAVRSGGVPVTPELISDCLTCLDQVVQWLDAIESEGQPPSDAAAAAEALLARFRTEAPLLEPAPPRDGQAGEAVVGPAHNLLAAQVDLLSDASAEASTGRIISALRVAANAMLAVGREDDAARLAHLIAQGAGVSTGAAAAAIQTLLSGGVLETSPLAARDADTAARAIRVDIERVDALVNLTGELAVAKNALGHLAALARAGTDGALIAGMLKEQHAVLARLVGELQRSVLNIRVLPMRQVFQRFPRLVREMVISLGKPARLVLEGEATEADKAIVEALFEPLLHVIRNALDHGVETGEVRAAAGKPPSATIRLSAARQGDHVVVEVEDDGGGIDVAAVRALAERRGLVDPASLAALTDADAIELIFAPGFSTAGEVTNLSGRGVGMDAVRSAVERLGGAVRLESRPGEGTVVRLVLPFTVMMSAVMTVEVGDQSFGIPMESVLETVRVPRTQIVEVGKAKAFVLRDRTVPLIDLASALGQPARSREDGEATIVVASARGHLGAVEVDRLGERMDVMLKPLEGLLAGTPGLAGATLLGDGRILLVLDLEALLL